MGEKRKGFRYMLEVYKILENRFSGTFKLTAVGSGEEQWRKWSTLGDIRFPGAVSDDELQRFYANCDIFCGPSIGGESFGIVLLEALKYSKPVVSFDIPGYREVLENNESGLLVKNKSSHSMAEAIIQIYQNKQLYNTLSKNAERVIQQYDEKKL